MKGKEVTTEELAQMIQTDVVARMATKGEVGAISDRVDRNFKLLVDEIRLLRADFRDLGTSVKSLVSIVASHDKEITRIKDHAGHRI